MSRRATPNPPTRIYPTRAEESALRDAQKLTYTVTELSAMLGISADSVRREAHALGQVAGIPAIRVGTRVVFARALVDAMLGIGRERAAS